MNSFDANIARSYLGRYFRLDSLDYLLSRMTLGQLHIWVGNGNNGKTTFSGILNTALYSLKGVRLHARQLLESPSHIPAGNRLLIVEDSDWEGTDQRMRVESLLELLLAGHTIILISQTLPVLEAGDAATLELLLERTHVLRFKSQFTNSTENAAEHKHIAEPCIPTRTMAEYINRKFSTVDLLMPTPNHFKKMHRQLRLLAEIVPATASIASSPRLDAAANTAISIILQHKDTSRRDDVLRIDIDPDSDGFLVEFAQNYIGSVVKTVMTFEALGVYLRIFFHAAEQDEDGYEHVQFNVPLFSSVCVPIFEAYDYASENLGEQISFLMEGDWPCEHVKGAFKIR
jgi:hypothetical protein